MRILKLLNRLNFSIIFFIVLLCISTKAEDNPADIWNIDKKETEKKTSEDSQILDQNNNTQSTQSSIYKMQSKKQVETIKLEQNLNSNEVKLLGLYDPEEYGLDINMWINSDGDQLKNIFSKLNKIDFSDDAIEIMNISVLTNAYYPTNNISEKEFLKFKSEWLIKNSDFDLIKKYLIKNQAFDIQPELTRYFLDEFLSSYQLEKACEIFSENLNPINDKYLSKFEIYCLIK